MIGGERDRERFFWGEERERENGWGGGEERERERSVAFSDQSTDSTAPDYLSSTEMIRGSFIASSLLYLPIHALLQNPNSCRLLTRAFSSFNKMGVLCRRSRITR